MQGIDGRTLSAVLPADACCPPSPCSIDDCAFVCSFVQAALPDGPLWDQAKHDFNAARMPNCVVDGDAILAEDGSKLREEDGGLVLWNVGPATSACPSLIGHAAFVAKMTLYHIRNAIWPAVREASPFTAWTTRQYWLDRWGWSNCFFDPNRPEVLGAVTPYEIPAHVCADVAEQGAVALPDAPSQRRLCPPTIPQDLQDAVTRGTIIALARRSLAPIPNLDSLNFIIAPLGARLSIASPFDVWTAIDRRASATCRVPNFFCQNADDQGALAVDTSLVQIFTDSPAGLAVEDWEEQGTGSGFDPIRGPFVGLCRGARSNTIVNADYEQGQDAEECCVYDVPLCLVITPDDLILGDAIAECPRVTPPPRRSYLLAEDGSVLEAEDGSRIVWQDVGIQSYIEPNDPRRPARIYPGALAAECIVRSILPDTMPYTLTRFGEAPAPPGFDISLAGVASGLPCADVKVCGQPFTSIPQAGRA